MATPLVSVSRQMLHALVASNVALLLLVVILFLSGFRTGRFDDRELSVERLNIVDSLGRPLMVLANARRLPGAVFAGKEYPQSFVERGRSAGLLFYNSVGDEVGGLIYEGGARDSSYRAIGHLSFDQWQQSQVVALSYSDDGRSRSAGLRIWDRPTEPLEQQFRIAEQFVAATGALRDSLRAEMVSARARVAGTQRVFVGSQNRTAGVEVRDAMGRVRVRLAVDSLGAARLEFLDEQGLAVARYPEP